MNPEFAMDEKKERIVTIAEKIFSRFGFRKTTMDEIAKMARMGKSTLYYYFKSKEDIWAEVIRKESHILRQKLHEAVRNAVTPQEKIRTYVLTRMKHLKELSNYYTTLTDDYFDHYAFIEKEREDFTRYEIDTLTRILREGAAQGVFTVENAEITAQMIILALKGLEYPLLVENGLSHDIDHTVNRMLQILFKGIEIR